MVERIDVEEAERLIRVATHQAATDPMTGKIDMDIITSGVSAQVRETIKKIGQVVKTILREDVERARKGVEFERLFEEVKRRMEKEGMSSTNEIDFRNALKDLEELQIVGLFKHAKNPLVRYLEAQNQ